jgi:hypothetical protein
VGTDNATISWGKLEGHEARSAGQEERFRDANRTQPFPWHHPPIEKCAFEPRLVLVWRGQPSNYQTSLPAGICSPQTSLAIVKSIFGLGSVVVHAERAVLPAPHRHPVVTKTVRNLVPWGRRNSNSAPCVIRLTAGRVFVRPSAPKNNPQWARAFISDSPACNDGAGWWGVETGRKKGTATCLGGCLRQNH